MIESERSLRALSPAERARTVLAASDVVAWRDHDGAPTVPFVEQAGSLLVLVEVTMREEMLASGSGRLDFTAVPSLGDLRLHGEFWPVSGTSAQTMLTDLRGLHSTCGDCQIRNASHVVGFQVDRVELRLPGREFGAIDLDHYLAVEPDPAIAVGVPLAEHLNALHAPEVRQFGGALRGRPVEEIVAATIDWVDSRGVEVSVIDTEGAGTFRVDFGAPVMSTDGLCDAAHHVLSSVVSD